MSLWNASSSYLQGLSSNVIFSKSSLAISSKLSLPFPSFIKHYYTVKISSSHLFDYQHNPVPKESAGHTVNAQKLLTEWINTICKATFHLFYIYPPGLNKHSRNRDQWQSFLYYYISLKNEHVTLQFNNLKIPVSCFLCVCSIIYSNMSKVFKLSLKISTQFQVVWSK